MFWESTEHRVSGQTQEEESGVCRCTQESLEKAKAVPKFAIFVLQSKLFEITDSSAQTVKIY